MFLQILQEIQTQYNCGLKWEEITGFGGLYHLTVYFRKAKKKSYARFWGRVSLGHSILSKLIKAIQIACKAIKPNPLFYKGINTTKNSCKNITIK